MGALQRMPRSLCATSNQYVRLPPRCMHGHTCRHLFFSMGELGRGWRLGRPAPCGAARHPCPCFSVACCCCRHCCFSLLQPVPPSAPPPQSPLARRQPQGRRRQHGSQRAAAAAGTAGGQPVYGTLQPVCSAVLCVHGQPYVSSSRRGRGSAAGRRRGRARRRCDVARAGTAAAIGKAAVLLE